MTVQSTRPKPQTNQSFKASNVSLVEKKIAHVSYRLRPLPGSFVFCLCRPPDAWLRLPSIFASCSAAYSCPSRALRPAQMNCNERLPYGALGFSSVETFVLHLTEDVLNVKFTADGLKLYPIMPQQSVRSPRDPPPVPEGP